MISAEANDQKGPFPMRVLCPGCGTAYKLEGAKQFTCPHCGNHIEVSPDGTVEFRPEKKTEEEPVVTISARRPGPPTEVETAHPATQTVQPESKIEDSVPVKEDIPEAQPAQAVEERDAGMEEAEKISEKEEEEKKEEEETEAGTAETGKEEEIEEEKKGETGAETPESAKRKHRLSSMAPEKKALIAVGIAGILILSLLAFALMPKERFSVRMAPEKIGDRGNYDVEGRIYLNAENGVSVGNGVIQELNIRLMGDGVYQINSTASVEDGFGIEHRTLDKYLYQSVRLSGSAKMAGANTNIDDAGTIVTEDSSFIDLTTNKTIKSTIWNNANIHILSLYRLTTEDRGIYFPTSSSSGYNLFDLRQRDYREGDTGTLAGGSLKWKGEKKEHVYRYDTLKLHVTENNSGSSWRQISGDVWVASECSMPVKVHMHMKIDTTKLPETEKLLLAYLLPTGGTVEVDYTATMKDFSRGTVSIPWGTCTASHTTQARSGVEFDKEWNYTPPLRNSTLSFDPDFSPESAAGYAIEKSDGLRSYIERHKTDVYVVDGKYSVSNGTESWRFIFGYRESGLNTQMDGYNITVQRKGDNLTLTDQGLEKINNPSNSRPDISQAMNIADSEGIFENMSLLHSLFSGGKIDFQHGVVFRMQNSYLHTGLSLSTFNPMVQNNVPAGYGYYLQKETREGNNYRFTEGMIDSSNGRVIYEMDHHQTG